MVFLSQAHVVFFSLGTKSLLSSEKKRKCQHQKEDGNEDETPRRPKKPKNLEYYLVDVPDEYDKALYDRHVQVCW